MKCTEKYTARGVGRKWFDGEQETAGFFDGKGCYCTLLALLQSFGREV